MTNDRNQEWAGGVVFGAGEYLNSAWQPPTLPWWRRAWRRVLAFFVLRRERLGFFYGDSYSAWPAGPEPTAAEIDSVMALRAERDRLRERLSPDVRDALEQLLDETWDGLPRDETVVHLYRTPPAASTAVA